MCSTCGGIEGFAQREGYQNLYYFANEGFANEGFADAFPAPGAPPAATVPAMYKAFALSGAGLSELNKLAGQFPFVATNALCTYTADGRIVCGQPTAAEGQLRR